MTKQDFERKKNYSNMVLTKKPKPKPILPDEEYDEWGPEDPDDGLANPDIDNVKKISKGNKKI